MVPERLKGLSGAGVLVLVLVALMGVGCCTRYKKDIEQLHRDKDDLTQLKSDAEAELSRARTSEQAMQSQLGAAETKLATAQATIKDLEAKLAAKPAGGGTPSNGGTVALKGETTVYKQTVGSDVLFSSGRATLTAAGKTALAAAISKITTQYAGNVVRVYGHTDSDPIVKTKKLWADNLDLSANRAMAVARYLISKGVPKAKVETVAMGASRPVADNKTKAGKAKNRRVEIVVVK